MGSVLSDCTPYRAVIREAVCVQWESSSPSHISKTKPFPRSPPAASPARTTNRFVPLGETLLNKTPLSSAPNAGWFIRFLSLGGASPSGTCATETRAPSDGKSRSVVVTCKVSDEWPSDDDAVCVAPPGWSLTKLAPETTGIAVNDSKSEVSWATAAASSSSVGDDDSVAVASVSTIRFCDRPGGALSLEPDGGTPGVWREPRARR